MNQKYFQVVILGILFFYLSGFCLAYMLPPEDAQKRMAGWQISYSTRDGVKYRCERSPDFTTYFCGKWSDQDWYIGPKENVEIVTNIDNPADAEAIASGLTVWYEIKDGELRRCVRGPAWAGFEGCAKYLDPLYDNQDIEKTSNIVGQNKCVKQDGRCDTNKGENCKTCPVDCDCYDLICSPGEVGATSWGCFDPCIDYKNTVYNPKTDRCDCKKGYAPNEEMTECVPAMDDCPKNSFRDGENCVCESGYGNCDENIKNGCELDLGDDKENCGECGNKCASNTICKSATCVCETGFIDVSKNSGKNDCQKVGCNDNGNCEPDNKETCRNCGDCLCSPSEMCNTVVIPKTTDSRGCRDCEKFCQLLDPHYRSYGSNGVKCDCWCEDGYHYDIDQKKCTNSQMDWEKTKKTIEKEINSPIGICDYIYYLERIEEKNPGKNWQQIVSQFHQSIYNFDAELSFFGISLFKNGKENEGFEEVDLITGHAPVYVMNRAGEKIKIAHSYAALRAGLNRWGAIDWTMTKINTDWGDLVQVAGGKLNGSWEDIHGETGMLFSTLWGDDESFEKYRKIAREGERRYKTAGGYRSKDQWIGNKMGMDVRSIINEKPDMKLSEAYRKYFKKLGEKCD